MKTIENQTFDMERALYGSRDIEVKNCRFDGPADGESAFKECSNVRADHCFFNLRYPFWHDHGLRITDSEMTELCRAALWYTDHVEIVNTKMHGINSGTRTMWRSSIRRCTGSRRCGSARRRL